MPDCSRERAKAVASCVAISSWLGLFSLRAYSVPMLAQAEAVELVVARTNSPKGVIRPLLRSSVAMPVLVRPSARPPARPAAPLIPMPLA